jgi:hypothetical protein
VVVPLGMDLFGKTWREHGLIGVRYVEQDRLLASNSP